MTATLNGRLCSDVSITMPRYGNWRALVVLQDSAEVSTSPGGASLDVAGISLVGTVVGQGERGGQRGIEVVGGRGGWAGAPPPLGHGLAGNGIKLSAFASALGQAVGETVVFGATDRALGTMAVRLGQQGAGELLSEACACPPGSPVVPWYVDTDGTTRVGERDGPAVDPEIVDADELDQWRVYVLDDVTPLLPGGTIDGRVIEELRVTASGGKVRALVTLGVPGAAPSTFAAKLRRFVLGCIGPRVAAARIYRYSVREVYDNLRVRAVPVRAVLAPDLDGLRVWPGIPGGRGRPKVGSEILIQFADGDIGYPVVRGFAPSIVGSNGIPDVTELDGDRVNLGDGATGDLVARLTDGSDAGRFRIRLPPGGSPPPNTFVITYQSPDGIELPWVSVFASGLSILPAVAFDPASGPALLELRAKLDDVSQGKVYA